MFTGIIEEVGKVQAIKKGTRSFALTIEAKKVLEDIQLGDSMAVNGVCLTTTSFGRSFFTADVMHETLNRSSLGRLKVGSFVNLERAMAVNGRFGGHLVLGHTDGSGIISKIQKDDISIRYTVKAAPDIMRYIIEKGSITIEGISLTVTHVTHDDFIVSVIPHTAQNTNLSRKGIGDIVNIENDCLGKYVEKILGHRKQNPSSPITKEFLMKLGY